MKRYFLLGILTLILAFLYISLGCKSQNSAVSETPADVHALSAPSDTGEAYIWFLGHCGFAVQTKSAFLIFDYIEELPNGGSPMPENPSIWSGYIMPHEIAEFNVHVFTTHEHGDHFDPVIFDWEESIPSIQYYFGWQGSDNPDHHCLTGPRTVYTDETLEIYTINSNHSGVDESAFLVKLDGLVIYHNGDYQGDYLNDFLYLNNYADSIDLAFVSCVWQSQWTYYDINVKLITQLMPKALFPMHVRAGDEDEYFGPFLNAFHSLMGNGQIVLTNNDRGIAYCYRKGLINVFPNVD